MIRVFSDNFGSVGCKNQLDRIIYSSYRFYKTFLPCQMKRSFRLINDVYSALANW